MHGIWTVLTQVHALVSLYPARNVAFMSRFKALPKTRDRPAPLCWYVGGMLLKVILCMCNTTVHVCPWVYSPHVCKELRTHNRKSRACVHICTLLTTFNIYCILLHNYRILAMYIMYMMCGRKLYVLYTYQQIDASCVLIICMCRCLRGTVFSECHGQKNGMEVMDEGMCPCKRCMHTYRHTCIHVHMYTSYIDAYIHLHAYSFTYPYAFCILTNHNMTFVARSKYS
jgi:hypothetical protein